MRAVDEVLSRRGVKRVRLAGLAGSAPAMLITQLKKRREPALVIANDAEQAGYLYSDMAAIAQEGDVAYFPSGFRRHIRFGQPDPAMQILRAETPCAGAPCAGW